MVIVYASISHIHYQSQLENYRFPEVQIPGNYSWSSDSPNLYKKTVLEIAVVHWVWAWYSQTFHFVDVGQNEV